MAARRDSVWVPVSTAIVVVASTVAAAAINAGTSADKWPGILEDVHVHPFRWSVGLTALVVFVGFASWWINDVRGRRMDALIPAVERPNEWVVERPAELERVVEGLRRRGDVGITTALHGAGGLGKTTLARLVWADRRILRRFGGRIYWVTFGRDVRTAAAIADRVNDLIKRIDPDRPVAFTDPSHAGAHLMALLNQRPRRLLILDDVWYPEQLAPFGSDSRWSARLLTTRVESLLDGRSVAVQVDQLSHRQARALLSHGLPRGDDGVVLDGVLRDTGRWPLLLRLVNKVLLDQVSAGADVNTIAAVVRQRLRDAGAVAIDDLTGQAARELDINDPQRRHQAVRATIHASSGLLEADERTRLAELAVFAEDTAIPIDLIATLWRATSEMDAIAARQLCVRLHDLALISILHRGATATVSLHDVIRDYLSELLTAERETHLHALLLDLVAAQAGDRSTPAAWWNAELSDYLQDHLIEHLIAAGRSAEAERLATDLRWVAARLARFGPAAPHADLSRIDSPAAAHLRTQLARAAHLLGPTNPPQAQIDILLSRMGDDPQWQRHSGVRAYFRPALVNRLPLPDLPDPALQRSLTGHVGAVAAVAVSPDGRWVASGGDDGAVTIWDVSTGHVQARLRGHSRRVTALAYASRSGLLASGSADGTVRIWDVDSREELARLSCTIGWVPPMCVALSPNGKSVAAGGDDGQVRVWDVASGRILQRISAHRGWVRSVAMPVEGDWLASGGEDCLIRIWDTATGQVRRKLSGHDGWVQTVAIAPDGTWLASAGNDRTIRIWDLNTGSQRAVLNAHSDQVRAVAIAPDGTWLASAGDDRTIRIWDASSGRQRAVLNGHGDWIRAIAIAPDGTWLATAGDDGSVRIWESATSGRGDSTGGADATTSIVVSKEGAWVALGGPAKIRVDGLPDGYRVLRLIDSRQVVRTMAPSPAGDRLGVGTGNGKVQIWDVGTGQVVCAFRAYQDWVQSATFSADGNRIATGGSGFFPLRLWDANSGRELRKKITGHAFGITAVVFAPNDSWLATSGWDGTVWLRNPSTGRRLAGLRGHRGGVTALAVGHDGELLAAAGADGTVTLWNTKSRSVRAKLVGHDGRISAIALSPDGVHLLTTGADRTIRIWHIEQRRAVALMRTDADIVTCAWSLDGHSVIVGGAAGLYAYEYRPTM